MNDIRADNRIGKKSITCTTVNSDGDSRCRCRWRHWQWIWQWTKKVRAKRKECRRALGCKTQWQWLVMASRKPTGKVTVRKPREDRGRYRGIGIRLIGLSDGCSIVAAAWVENGFDMHATPPRNRSPIASALHSLGCTLAAIRCRAFFTALAVVPFRRDGALSQKIMVA